MRSRSFPLEAIKKAGELGFLGAIFPEELGGAGLGYIDYAIIIEELSRVDPSVGLIVAAHNSLCTNHIYLAGSEEQRQKYIPKLATGEWIGCWSLTEPEAGSDAAGTRTKAVKDGALLGAERRQDLHHQRPVRRRLRRHGGDRSRRVAARHLGIHSRKGHARLPRRQEGEQARNARQRDRRGAVHRLPRRRNRNCSASAAKASSIACAFSTAAASPSPRWRSALAQGAYEAALKYSKQRKQFGRFISEFQAIQNKLADMATEIEAARLLTYRAGWMKDQGQRVTKESSMAKLFSSEIAVRVANEAVQIHGGYGFIKDYPVEKFYRDVKLCTIGEGTSEIQRLVIARQLLKIVTDWTDWARLSEIRGRRSLARLGPRRHRHREPVHRAERCSKNSFPHTGRRR